MNRNEAEEMAAGLNASQVYAESLTVAGIDVQLKVAYDVLNTLAHQRGLYTLAQRLNLKSARVAVVELTTSNDHWRDALRGRWEEFHPLPDSTQRE